VVLRFNIFPIYFGMISIRCYAMYKDKQSLTKTCQRFTAVQRVTGPPHAKKLIANNSNSNF
jgi:hypothetical protein